MAESLISSFLTAKQHQHIHDPWALRGYSHKNKIQRNQQRELNIYKKISMRKLTAHNSTQLLLNVVSSTLMS